MAMNTPHFNPKLNFIYNEIIKIRKRMTEIKSEMMRRYEFEKCRVFLIHSPIEFEYAMHMSKFFENLDKEESKKIPMLFFFDNEEIVTNIDKYRYFCWDTNTYIKGLYEIRMIYTPESKPEDEKIEGESLNIYGKDFMGAILSSLSFNFESGSLVHIYMNSFGDDCKYIENMQDIMFNMSFFEDSNNKGKQENIRNIAKDRDLCERFTTMITNNLYHCCYDKNEIVLTHYEMLLKELKFWILRDLDWMTTSAKSMLAKRGESEEDDE